MSEHKLLITDHALLRGLERFGGRTKLEGKIRRIVAFGKVLEKSSPLIELLNHNYKKAKHYMLAERIAVVVDNKVVTVYSAKISKKTGASLVKSRFEKARLK